MMTIDERMDRLTGIVEALAASVVAHDDQLDKLLVISEKNAANWDRLERQWQAYLNTLPRN